MAKPTNGYIKTKFCKQCKKKNGAKAHAKKNNMTSSKTINNRKFNWRLITRRFGRTSVNKKKLSKSKSSLVFNQSDTKPINIQIT